jgi:peptidoglycan/LPS O-acetylase OafA/YrhL
MTLVFVTHPVNHALTSLLGNAASSVITSVLAICASLLVASYFTRLVDEPSVVMANKVGKWALGRVRRRKIPPIEEIIS